MYFIPKKIWRQINIPHPNCLNEEIFDFKLFKHVEFVTESTFTLHCIFLIETSKQVNTENIINDVKKKDETLLSDFSIKTNEELKMVYLNKYTDREFLLRVDVTEKLYLFNQYIYNTQDSKPDSFIKKVKFLYDDETLLIKTVNRTNDNNTANAFHFKKNISQYNTSLFDTPGKSSIKKDKEP